MNNRIKIGTRLRLGDDGIYEITDIYFAIEENSGQYQAFIEFKDENDVITTIPMWMVLELLQSGNIFRPESKLSQDYYREIVKPRLDKLRN